MSTNPTFERKELELLLITLLKTRNILFDCVEIKFDKKSLKKPVKYNPIWRGKRGTFPALCELDKILDLVRLHINSDETIQFYTDIGMFDMPSKKVTKKSNVT